ncbi:hypothetical protein HDU81_007156 [Chytriomyces hyalinus]|nr:hypothetical protein HDU81_007156 [Chytriomyces hyalinus]
MQTQPCSNTIDDLADQPSQRTVHDGGARDSQPTHSSDLLPNSDSSAADSHHEMASGKAFSSETGFFKSSGDGSLVGWQKPASRPQQCEQDSKFSGVKRSNTARNEPNEIGNDGGISSSDSHHEIRTLADIALTMQIEVASGENRSGADGSPEISGRVNEGGGQEVMIQTRESFSDFLTNAAITESAETKLASPSASAERMTARDLPRTTQVNSVPEKDVCSIAGITVDNGGEVSTFNDFFDGFELDWKNRMENALPKRASNLNSTVGPATSQLESLEKECAIVDSPILSPGHSDVHADTSSDAVNVDALPGSGEFETQATSAEEGMAISSSTETFGEHQTPPKQKSLITVTKESSILPNARVLTVAAPPSENVKNDAECDEVKFEGRVTRLSRKHQLEASVDSPAKRRRTSNATYYGRIEDTLDAGIIVEACIKGILMEVSGVMEASSIGIRAGTVLAIHERYGNIQRWRDGYQWSPSRISGGFLIYRQVERKDGTPASEGAETPKNNPDGAKLVKGKSFTVLPAGLTKKTISMIGSDSQSYRVISYYETEDAKARSSLINQPALSGPRITAYKALPRPSKDETFSSLDLYPKEPDPTISSDWLNKRKRKTVVTPQIDRRYPEYEPQMSDYPIMFPYMKVDAATDVAQVQVGPSLRTEKLADRKRVLNEQPPSLPSLHQVRASATFAPQAHLRASMVEQHVTTSARPVMGYTPFTSSSNTYYHQGNASFYSAQQPPQHHAYQAVSGGFVPHQQRQHQQQQYTLGPVYVQPSYGPRPSSSSSTNGHYPFPPPQSRDHSRHHQ